MASLTCAYEERAKKSINSNLFRQPNDRDIETGSKKHLWINEDHEGTINAQVFDLEDHGDYSGHSDLQQLLMHATRVPALGRTSRRIIIMEDINRRYAELLGVRLKIPPEFFFAHCSEFLNLSVVDECSAVQYGRYWRVPIPQKRTLLPISKEQCGAWNIESGFFNRHVVFVEQYGINVEIGFNGQVSYWATEYDSGSWTGNPPDNSLWTIKLTIVVFILVDPHITTLRREQSPHEVKELVPLRICYRHNTEVTSNTTEDPLVQAEHRSLYASLVASHATALVAHTSRPLSATAFVRNLVRAAWEEYIWKEEWEVNDTLIQDNDDHRYYQGLSPSEVGEKENEKAKKYQAIINARRGLKLRQRRLKDINHAFALEDVELHAEHDQGGTAKLKLEREGRLWKRLRDKLEDMDASLSQHMDEYAQRAAMEERFEANRQAADAERQARSAGQLTKIATIIVPCTFVASIFSMGGSFAAGEDLFYVYWAISVPATVALLIWVLHKDIRKTWKDLRSTEWRKSQRRTWKLWLTAGCVADVEKGTKDM